VINTSPEHALKCVREYACENVSELQ